MISTVTMSLAGCGGDSGDDSSRVSGVSTGGTGNSISPGLGGGGDTNPALNTNANNGIVVNSATQPPLLATEASLSIYPLRLVQNQESVKFYANTAPTVVKYTLASNLKAEGILPTVDGAMVLFSTPSQTGYQVISFDGVGTPLASKVYGVDGKLMAIRHQQSSNNSYFIDLLLNDPSEMANCLEKNGFLKMATCWRKNQILLLISLVRALLCWSSTTTSYT